MNRTLINKEVAVTALSFRKNYAAFPKRMEYNGETYSFLDTGFHYLVKKGEQIIKLFDVTDGASTFRLSCDADQSHWTLIAIK